MPSKPVKIIDKIHQISPYLFSYHKRDIKGIDRARDEIESHIKKYEKAFNLCSEKQLEFEIAKATIALLKQHINASNQNDLNTLFHEMIVLPILKYFESLSCKYSKNTPPFPPIWKHICSLEEENLKWLTARFREIFESNFSFDLLSIINKENINQCIKSKYFEEFMKIGNHYYSLKTLDYFIKILPKREKNKKLNVLDKLSYLHCTQQIAEYSKHLHVDIAIQNRNEKFGFDIDRFQKIRNELSHLNHDTMETLLNSDALISNLVIDLKGLRDHCIIVKKHYENDTIPGIELLSVSNLKAFLDRENNILKITMKPQYELADVENYVEDLFNENSNVQKSNSNLESKFDKYSNMLDELIINSTKHYNTILENVRVMLNTDLNASDIEYLISSRYRSKVASSIMDHCTQYYSTKIEKYSSITELFNKTWNEKSGKHKEFYDFILNKTYSLTEDNLNSIYKFTKVKINTGELDKIVYDEYINAFWSSPETNLIDITMQLLQILKDSLIEPISKASFNRFRFKVLLYLCDHEVKKISLKLLNDYYIPLQQLEIDTFSVHQLKNLRHMKVDNKRQILLINSIELCVAQFERDQKDIIEKMKTVLSDELEKEDLNDLFSNLDPKKSIEEFFVGKDVDKIVKLATDENTIHFEEFLKTIYERPQNIESLFNKYCKELIIQNKFVIFVNFLYKSIKLAYEFNITTTLYETKAEKIRDELLKKNLEKFELVFYNNNLEKLRSIKTFQNYRYKWHHGLIKRFDSLINSCFIIEKDKLQFKELICQLNYFTADTSSYEHEKLNLLKTIMMTNFDEIQNSIAANQLKNDAKNKLIKALNEMSKKPNKKYTDKLYKRFIEKLSNEICDELYILNNQGLINGEINILFNMLNKSSFNANCIDWHNDAKNLLEKIFHATFKTNGEKKEAKLERKNEIYKNLNGILETTLGILELNLDNLVTQTVLKKTIDNKIKEIEAYNVISNNEPKTKITKTGFEADEQRTLEKIETFLSDLKILFNKVEKRFLKEELSNSETELMDYFRKLGDLTSNTNTGKENFQILHNLNYFKRDLLNGLITLRSKVLKKEWINKISENIAVNLNSDFNEYLINLGKKKIKLNKALKFFCACFLDIYTEQAPSNFTNMKQLKDFRNTIFHTDPFFEDNKTEYKEYVTVVNILCNIQGLNSNSIMYD